MWDAALIQEDYKCPVYIHTADAAMVLDTSYVKMFGVAMPPRALTTVEDLNFDRARAGQREASLCAGEEFQHLPPSRSLAGQRGRFIIPAGAC